MSKSFLQAKHSNESRSWSSFSGVAQIRRIILPHLGQPGRSATLSGNATVVKGTIQPERDLSLFVPTRLSVFHIMDTWPYALRNQH